MVKTLTKHGNSWALIIDKAILDLLKIDPDTPLEVTTNGQTLSVTPVADSERSKKRSKILAKLDKAYGDAFKELA